MDESVLVLQKILIKCSMTEDMAKVFIIKCQMEENVEERNLSVCLYDFSTKHRVPMMTFICTISHGN